MKTTVKLFPSPSPEFHTTSNSFLFRIRQQIALSISKEEIIILVGKSGGNDSLIFPFFFTCFWGYNSHLIVKAYCLGFHYLNNLLSRGLLPISFSISLTTYINYCPQKRRTCMHLEKTLMKNIMYIL